MRQWLPQPDIITLKKDFEPPRMRTCIPESNCDGFAKSPIPALRLIFRHSTYFKVRLLPKESRALNLNFFLCHQNIDFSEFHPD
jgi:hypothetical protein